MYVRTNLPQEKQPSEIFWVVDPSTSVEPPLALLSPVAGEHVAIGAKFSVSWTSPIIDRWVALSTKMGGAGHCTLLRKTEGPGGWWVVPSGSSSRKRYVRPIFERYISLFLREHSEDSVRLLCPSVRWEQKSAVGIIFLRRVSVDLTTIRVSRLPRTFAHLLPSYCMCHH